VTHYRLIENTHLQQLHHGKADISIQVIVLHQLLLQADWLTQVHIGLAQQMEQRHCLLILWSSTLQAGLDIVSLAVQQQWIAYRPMGCWGVGNSSGQQRQQRQVWHKGGESFQEDRDRYSVTRVEERLTESFKQALHDQECSPVMHGCSVRECML